jgi:hypothetical protein
MSREKGRLDREANQLMDSCSEKHWSLDIEWPEKAVCRIAKLKA